MSRNSLEWKTFPNGVQALGAFGRVHHVPHAVGWIASAGGAELGRFDSLDEAIAAVEQRATDSGHTIRR